MLRLKSDRYRGRDICVHEFAHSILGYGLCEITREAVINQYKWSVHKGLWPGCYAATNFDEFFAESAMWYFGTTGDPGQIDPPPESGAEWLRNYDPGTFALLDDIFSGRANVKVLDWHNLSMIAAEREIEMSSQNSNTPTQIRIFNKSSEPVKVYWLDFRGTRNFYLQIEPGDSFHQITFTTHPWLVTDLEDRGIGIYLAAALPSIATIE